MNGNTLLLTEKSVAGWHSGFEGVFSPVGSVAANQGLAFQIWSATKTVASFSSSQSAAMLRLPRPINGRLLDHLGLRFILSGTMKVGGGSSQTIASAGDSLFIDLTQPVRLEYAREEDPTAELTFWVPRKFAPEEFTALDGLHGLLVRGGAPAISVLNATAKEIHATLDQLSSNERDQLITGLFALAARLAVRCATRTSGPPGLESFATICRFIEINLAARDLGAERLASTFGLSRASLYRLFEPVGGVASYVRARRLNHARQELLAAGRDNRRIGPIAYQSGFRSVTAFNRAFREVYGETPRDARRTRVKALPSYQYPPANSGALAQALLAITA